MSQSAPRFRDVFEAFVMGAPLPRELVRGVFDAILAGAWTPVQVAGLLVALRLRAPSAEVITAAAEAMRGAMTEVQHGLPEVIDTCGTGGDSSGTLNLSTGAAILVAAAGFPVAKHGNRAVSSQAGSADVLEALGVALDVPVESAASVLRQTKIAFLMAPAHHPAIRHSMVARRELGIRTLFNILGPLCNPARVSHQLLGAYDDTLRPLLAQALLGLGVRRAWVVRGVDGLDEVSPYAPTRVSELSDGTIRELLLQPEDFGLQLLPAGAAKGGDALFNAWVLEQVVLGKPHPSSDAFVLNAAAALVVARNLAPKDATQVIRHAIQSGAAGQTLKQWRALSQELNRPATGAPA